MLVDASISCPRTVSRSSVLLALMELQAREMMLNLVKEKSAAL